MCNNGDLPGFVTVERFSITQVIQIDLKMLIGDVVGIFESERSAI